MTMMMVTTMTTIMATTTGDGDDAEGDWEIWEGGGAGGVHGGVSVSVLPVYRLTTMT